MNLMVLSIALRKSSWMLAGIYLLKFNTRNTRKTCQKDCVDLCSRQNCKKQQADRRKEVLAEEVRKCNWLFYKNCKGQTSKVNYLEKCQSCILNRRK